MQDTSLDAYVCVTLMSDRCLLHCHTALWKMTPSVSRSPWRTRLTP